MGIYNKFEKLDMLGEIDEKYIKQAEKYLAEPLMADTAVIRLAPVRRKLSWKPFAAFAACAAVLIGGTAFLANYLNSRPITPPVYESGNSSNDQSSSEDNSDISNTSKTYLDRIREQYNVSDNVKISYVTGNWEWTEFEISGDDDGFYGPMVRSRLQNDAAFLDKRTMLTVRTLEDGSQEIAAYDLFDKTFTPIFGKDDEPKLPVSVDSIKYSISYANDGRIVFLASFYQGATALKHEPRVIDVSSGDWQVIPVDYSNLRSSMLIEGNMLYYTVNDPAKEHYDPNGLVYRYDLSLNGTGAPELVGSDAYRLFSCRGEIVYSTFEGDFAPDEIFGTEKLHKLNGGDPFDTEKYDKNAWAIKNAGYFSTDSYEVTNCETGETLFTLPGGAMIDGISDSCITFGDANLTNPDYFIYDASANELFIYNSNSYGADFNVTGAGWEWYKCGDGFCVFDDGVNKASKGYILTKKTDTQTQTTKPEDTRLDSLRNKYSIKIPMGYVEDSFDIAQYDLPEIINSKYVYYEKIGVIDKSRIVAMLYDDNNRELHEFGIYNFTNGSYKPVFQPSVDELMSSTLQFANEDYLVFTSYKKDPESENGYGKGSMYIIDLASGDYTPTPICTDDEIDLSESTTMVLLDGKLYFDNYRPADWRVMTSLYCYNIQTGQLEEIAKEGKEPAVYNGTIVYITKESTSDTVFKSLDGSVEISISASQELWVCESDIFKLNNGLMAPTSITTGEMLVSGGRQFMESGCGKYISFSDFPVGAKSIEYFVYDIANNKMLVYKGSTDCDHWLRDGTGISMFWHYSEYNGREVPYQINVFTEK